MDERELLVIEAQAHFGDYPIAVAEVVLALVAEVRRLRARLSGAAELANAL